MISFWREAVARAGVCEQTTSMESDLTARWRQRLQILSAQLERDGEDALAWRWRLDAKVLRFLLARYDRNAVEIPLQSCALSPMETALLRLSLAIPNVQTRPLRPSPLMRRAALERIARAQPVKADAEPFRLATWLRCANWPGKF